VQILDSNLIQLELPTMVNGESRNVNYGKGIASSLDHRLMVVWSGEEPNGTYDIF